MQEKKVIIGQYGRVPLALLAERPTLIELHAYIALESFQGQNENSFPGIEAIAARCGLQKGRVSTAITRLVERGWVHRVRRYGRSNLYVCLMAAQVPEAEIAQESVPVAAVSGSRKLNDDRSRRLNHDRSRKLNDYMKRPVLKDQLKKPEPPEAAAVKSPMDEFRLEAQDTKQPLKEEQAKAYKLFRDACDRLACSWSEGWKTSDDPKKRVSRDRAIIYRLVKDQGIERFQVALSRALSYRLMPTNIRELNLRFSAPILAAIFEDMVSAGKTTDEELAERADKFGDFKRSMGMED